MPQHTHPACDLSTPGKYTFPEFTVRKFDSYHLLALENSGEEVYYAAPEFHSAHELNNAYDSSTVADGSAFWAPSAIGPLPDDEKHYIAFSPGGTFGWLCSEPYRVERTDAATLLRERLPRQSRSERAREPSENYWRNVGNQLMELYRKYRQHEQIAADRFESTRKRRDPRDDASLISLTLFGCALLFVPREIGSPPNKGFTS